MPPPGPQVFGCSAVSKILGFRVRVGANLLMMVSMTIAGESFSRRTRAKQASLATFSNWTWNFMIGFFSQPIASDIHFRYGFVFAGANFLNMIIAAFFVYETADLTLEAIDQMYGDNSVTAWTSRSWVPAGFATRADLKAEVDDDLVKIPDEKQGRWKSKPDPITGEEQDTVRKAPETKINTDVEKNQE